MKKRPFHDPDRPDGGGLVASRQTVEDLALVEEQLRVAEAARTEAVAALARVTARRDGEVAVGMTLDQWLRAVTRQHGAVVSGIGCVIDVWSELPTVRRALLSGEACLDQAIAVARPAARLDRDLRRSLDLALAECGDWTAWDPQTLAWNVDRLLDELLPKVAIEREQSAARRQYVHVQPELDGQAITFWGRYEGLDAARFDATLNAATDTPKAGVPRGAQRALALQRILTDWATGRHRAEDSDAGRGPAVTIHLLVEDDHRSNGVAAEVLSSTKGFAPRLTADGLAQLTAHATDVTTITNVTRDGVPVAIKGRRGHATDDPGGLSEESTRELVTNRDRRCRAPGCSNPLVDVHHLTWTAHDGSDDPSNRAGLCARCHHRVVHRHRWRATLDHTGAVSWTRAGRTFTTLPRHRRVLRPPRAPGSVIDPDHCWWPTPLDQDGDPLPF